MKDNQAKYPQLRFKGFTDPWEQRKLGEVFNQTVEYINPSEANLELWSVTVENGLTPKTERYNREALVKKNDKFKVVHDGDIVYNPMNLTIGAVGFNKTGKSVAVSGYYITMNMNAYFSNNYFKTWLKSANAIKQYKLYATGSLIEKQRVQFPTLSLIKSYIPNFEEQQKIGTFFQQLDHLITLHQRKLAKFKELKQGYLQKLFPKNGSKFPQLRFAGFADAWEQRKLVSMTNYKNGKGHEDKQSTIGKLELINLNSISISGGLKHSGKFIDEADDTLQKDDLVMILSDVGHGDLLGRVALIPEDDRFVLNQRVALLRPNATADPQFLFSYINAHQYYFKAQGAGMSQLNISKGSVENFISFVPIIEEQKKIGTFFKQLDNTITLHQRKLEKLQELKKGYLQKMFC